MREVRLRYEIIGTVVRCLYRPDMEGKTERMKERCYKQFGSDVDGLFDDRTLAEGALAWFTASVACSRTSTWIFQLNEVEIE